MSDDLNPAPTCNRCPECSLRIKPEDAFLRLINLPPYFHVVCPHCGVPLFIGKIFYIGVITAFVVFVILMESLPGRFLSSSFGNVVLFLTPLLAFYLGMWGAVWRTPPVCRFSRSWSIEMRRAWLDGMAARVRRSQVVDGAENRQKVLSWISSMRQELDESESNI